MVVGPFLPSVVDPAKVAAGERDDVERLWRWEEEADESLRTRFGCDDDQGNCFCARETEELEWFDRRAAALRPASAARRMGTGERVLLVGTLLGALLLGTTAVWFAGIGWEPPN